METNLENCLEESKFIEDISDKEGTILTGIIAGFPGKKDLDVLKKYLADIKHKKLVGVRYLVKNIEHENDTFFLSSEFQEKLKVLAEHKLGFCLGLIQPQLPDMVKLVQSNPDVTFYVDHLASPFF